MQILKNNYATICKAYEPFFVNEQRYNVLWGSAGSAKSWSIAQKIIFRCLNELGTLDHPFRHNIAVVRKYKTTIKNSVYKQIKIVLESMGLLSVVSCNISDMSFHFWNGAEIYTMGLDDPEKIKSMMCSSIWVEEASELNDADFTMLDLRLRGIEEEDRQFGMVSDMDLLYYKQMILSFNPVSETLWLKKRFFDTDQDGDTYILHTTYKDNDFVGSKYAAILEKRYKFDENLYRIYVKGEWGRIKTGSEFYFNFKRSDHVRQIDYQYDSPIHLGFDFNVNPYITALIVQILKRDYTDEQGKPRTHYFVNFIDEYALPNPKNTTEQLCDVIKADYKDKLTHGLYIYGDASGRASSTKTNLNDYDIIEYILADFMTNYSNRVPRANPLVRRRRWFVNKMLYKGGFNISIQISEKCVKLIEDLENVIESEDGSKHKKIERDPVSRVAFERYGHFSDIFDYILCGAFENYYDTFI